MWYDNDDQPAKKVMKLFLSCLLFDGFSSNKEHFTLALSPIFASPIEGVEGKISKFLQLFSYFCGFSLRLNKNFILIAYLNFEINLVFGTAVFFPPLLYRLSLLMVLDSHV